MADFPVPVGPTNSRGQSCIRNRSRKYFCFSVSTVWIISSFIYNIVWIIYINLEHYVDYQLSNLHLEDYQFVNLQHCVDYHLINLRHCVDYLLSATLCTISYNIIRIISSSIDNYIVIHSLIRKFSNFEYTITI